MRYALMRYALMRCALPPPDEVRADEVRAATPGCPIADEAKGRGCVSFDILPMCHVAGGKGVSPCAPRRAAPCTAQPPALYSPLHPFVLSLHCVCSIRTGWGLTGSTEGPRIT
eukprot:TRINITY_DN662_c0_g1_i1.p2 TRINITY_DN662_c0_g1~~TRINITY_DN662_c0_g1_i1.p2  ORF type:complete len:113 (+),score=4.66 TRINITY_DN662_c0_g1_i1:557-895(+)